MAEEIDSVVIKKTQEILGSVLKKPALTEKSLKRPPFRFLHDIIANVIKTSGFFKGLYTPEELQSENVKDKESKISFLQKAIDVLAIATNQPVNLKPSKVVAGHDPQKTNLFLQVLGTAIKNKIDSKDAVENVLSEKHQDSPTKVQKERRASVDKKSKNSSDKAHLRSLTKTLEPVKKSSSQSKDTPRFKESSKDAKEKTKESRKEREKSRDRSKHKSDEHKKASKEKTTKSTDLESVKKEVVPDRSTEQTNGFQHDIESANVEDAAEVSADIPNGDMHEKTQDDDNNIATADRGETSQEKDKSHHSSKSARPPSARSRRSKPAEINSVAVPNGPIVATQSFSMMNGSSTSETNFEATLLPSFRPPTARPSSARPSSSRPAPPRIHIRHVVENVEPIERPTTAKPVENVIIDQNVLSDEEDAFLLMEEDALENHQIQTSNTLPAETPEEDKGSLVKKLLATKKDLEGGSQHSPTKTIEIDRSQDASRHLSTLKELTNLQGHIQSLSRCAVPLGRMLDFLQEDLDSMRSELHMWREEHLLNVQALHKEQNTTESLLEPLRSQLDDLDQLVQNQQDANSALKASIARNDDRIQRMLVSVNPKS